MLGPPKTAFASASGTRNGTRTFDSPQRPSFSNSNEPSTKNDRINFRDRLSKENQRPEKDGEQVRDSKSGGTQNRRSVKDDSDLWSNVRQQKPQDRSNGDRTQERERNGVRENRPQRGFDNHRRDADRDAEHESGIRRAGPGRGRNEPSWYRDETRKEDGESQDQESSKPRDWRDKERRGTRGSEPDWNRAPKSEMDPEWMDAPEPEEKKQSHTQEDFEQWKKRMKSTNDGIVDAPVEQRPPHDRTTSSTGANAVKPKLDTPLIVDSSADGFFGMWNEPKGKEASNKFSNGADSIPVSSGAKPSKPSKFTGFFNPKPDPEPHKQKVSLPLSAPSADASNEDKEGFQRILKLLDQQQQQPDGRSETPRTQQLREPPTSPPIPSSRGQETKDLRSLLGAKSPPGNAMPLSRDSDFLLKLMQQPSRSRPEQSSASFSGRPPAQDTPSGLLPFPNLMISPHDTPQQTPPAGPPPGYLEEVQARDKLNPGVDRRGPPPGLFDGNVPRQMATGQQLSGLPSGMQRPPGLDHALPPGYQHIQHSRQNVVPPPGFSAAPRGQNSFPPGLMPNERLQFGMPANASGRGMAPPGFMQPPPPGFSLPYGQEGLPFGNFSDGGNFGQGFPQQRRQ